MAFLSEAELEEALLQNGFERLGYERSTDAGDFPGWHFIRARKLWTTSS